MTMTKNKMRHRSEMKKKTLKHQSRVEFGETEAEACLSKLCLSSPYIYFSFICRLTMT